MKVKFFSVLAICALFVACENPFVNDLLPNKGGKKKPGATVSVTVDFENDAIGQTYESTGGYDNDEKVSPTVKVVADPANAGQKSLEISSTGYNQAAIIPIALPDGQTLSDAESFSFRIYLKDGTIHYKEVQVYAAGNPEAFVHGGFGNPANSQYAQFAANKMGETETIPELPPNEWTDYSIPISGLNSAISDLSGTIYLAIGIQHDKDEAITYLLDDLTFTFGTPKPPPASDIVDFENDSLGKTYGFIYGDDEPTSVKVVADPLNAGQKSLEIVSNNYNQAAIVPINLSKALNLFKSFTFRFNLTNGTLNDKDMVVYVASDTAAFKRYGFDSDTGNNQFAAYRLGSVSLENVNNKWDTYIIAIESPGNTISGLSGDVFLAIGINHSNTEGITYLLDDITFSDEAAPPPADFPTFVDFEGDAINKTYGYTRGDNDPTVTVAADPDTVGHSNQKSLRVVTSNSSAWNQAAVIPINLPDPLSAYRSFRFRFNLQTAGTLFDNGQPRKINVYVADNTAAFVRYGFGNASTNANQFANLLVGEVEPAYDETGSWVDYAVNFNSPNAAINSLSGNVYVAVGINHNTEVIYYLDDLTFSKQELQKQPGAALTGNLTVVDSSITTSGVQITAGSVSVPQGSTQGIEYSVSLTSAGSPGVWQTGLVFTGLTSEESYTAYARSAQNAFYNAGTVISSSDPFTTLGKGNGAAVTGSISISPANIKHNGVTLTVSSLTLSPATGQTIEYAVSETNSVPPSGWQTVTIFSGLKKQTTYYVFARAKENDSYKVGTPISSVSFTTPDVQLNTNVPPVVVDFEDDALGSTTKYTVTQGNGTGTVTIVNDPLNAGERSLNIRSTDYNRGAVIPIHLPFALENYQSFTFRFKVASGTPSNPQVSVYIADATSKFLNYGFGNPANHNPSNQQFANLLLGEVNPNFSADQWVEYEIEIVGGSLNQAIRTLSGNLYLAIGINSSGTIDLQFDDLTFNVKHDMATPAPSITPTTAMFAKDSPADILVNINLYLASIKNGATDLTEDTDYTIGNQGSTVTLKKEYFNGMTASSTPVTLTFTFKSGGTGSIAITVVDTSPSYGGTWYDFTKAATTPTGISTSSNLTAAVKVEAGVSVLEVNRPGGYGQPGQLMIPFDLGSTNLNTFTKLVLIARCSRGTDYNDKTVAVAVLNSDGTTWTTLKSQSTTNSVAPNDWTTSFKTIEIGTFSNIPSRTGPITIRIQWDQSNSLAYEFQYIGLGN